MNIGILGAGNIAEKMAYTISKMEDASCYAVASRELGKAQTFAKEYGFEKAYGSYEELACDPEVELVYIATPHSYHYEHAKLCLMHDKPVLCEKSFMLNAKQAEEILILSRERGVFITEAIWTRYMPSRKMIDEVIQSGRIGEVTFVTANLGYDISYKERLQNPDLGGGALLDVGIYPLSFISMILGNEPEEVLATCTKTATGMDEQNAVILKYPGGKMALSHSGMLACTEQYGIVYGTEGYLIAENINNVDRIKVYSKDRELLEEIKVPEQITGFEDEVRSAMKAIQEGAIECPEIPHKEMLSMMRLMDTLREKWGVKFPGEQESKA